MPFLDSQQLFFHIVVYDIGTKILYETYFVHNSTQKASPEKRSPLWVYIFLRSIFLAYQNKI